MYNFYIFDFYINLSKSVKNDLNKDQFYEKIVKKYLNIFDELI